MNGQLGSWAAVLQGHLAQPRGPPNAVVQGWCRSDCETLWLTGGSTHFPSALDCSVNVVSCSTALTLGEPQLTSRLAELDLRSVPPWKEHAVLPCAGRISICIT